MGSPSELLNQKIDEWLKWDQNSSTSTEISQLLEMKDFSGLEKRLMKRLEFGTAGLRGPLGAGFSKMNDLTVIQTSQGLCKYLLTQFGNVKAMGVVVGHDARHGSHRFARLCASVFLNAGIKVYLFSDIVPTPFVPFSVLKYKCAAGVMITASHNPKEDNGYKVYYSNGAQIISPHDKGIAGQIMANLEPRSSSWNDNFYKTSDICIDPLAEVMKDYMESIQKHCHHRELNEASNLNITYTAMHGVGAKYEAAAFRAFSLKPFFSTEEQAEPDPDFPTVKFPNPEEGKGALKLAIETAERNKSPFIIANDPDADRLAIAEKTDSDTWKIFSGNEIGFLLGWWAFVKHSELHANKFPGVACKIVTEQISPKRTLLHYHVIGDSTYMIHSTVSSRVLKAIGDVEGFQVVETLTGFKWMGNKAIDLTKEGNKVLFAFEEAIGFMFGDQVLDKDGVSAGAIISEMACYQYHKGSSVTKKLEELYQRYGIHVSNNSYYLCYSQDTIQKIFNRMRMLNNGTYPDTVGPFKVLAVRDLTDAYDSEQVNKKPILPTSKSSQMITFKFDEGCVATIRTSGTEPKIKYYSEIARKPGDTMTRADAAKKIDELIHHLVEELLEPKKNNLENRPES